MNLASKNHTTCLQQSAPFLEVHDLIMHIQFALFGHNHLLMEFLVHSYNFYLSILLCLWRILYSYDFHKVLVAKLPHHPRLIIHTLFIREFKIAKANFHFLEFISNSLKSWSIDIIILWYENLLATTCRTLLHSCLHRFHLELPLWQIKIHVVISMSRSLLLWPPHWKIHYLAVDLICLSQSYFVDLRMMYHLELQLELLIHLLHFGPISTFKHETS